MASNVDPSVTSLQYRVQKLEDEVSRLSQLLGIRWGNDPSPQYQPVERRSFDQLTITQEPGLVLGGNTIVAPVGALQGYTTLVVGSTTRKIPIYAV